MANRYSQSKKTDHDIAEITAQSFDDFGKRQNIQYMDSLINSLQSLVDNPKLGCIFIHSKTDKDYYYQQYVSHVIYYRQQGSDIFIVLFFIKKCHLKNTLPKVTILYVKIKSKASYAEAVGRYSHQSRPPLLV